MPKIVEQTRFALRMISFCTSTSSTLKILYASTFSEIASRLPILTAKISSLTSDGKSGSLSSMLSTAAFVEAASITFFPCMIACAIISRIVVVFPLPGGPSKKAKSGVERAFFTKLRCVLQPS